MKYGKVKIKRTIMRDEAYEILQEWIMTGKLEPEVKLRDQELSDLLGISRTPIREALLRLEDNGLVVTKANRWTSVAPINLGESENIYLIVEALEILAIEQGMGRLAIKDIKQLEETNLLFKKKLEQGNKLDALQADNAFHEKLVHSANNNELTRLLEKLKIKVQRMEIHYFSKADNSLESYREHEQIIQALKDNNLKQAVAATKANWKNSFSRIQKNTSEHD